VPKPTLFDYAGGDSALLRLAGAFHRRCLDDPVLSHPFDHPGLNPRHVERLAAYLGEVLGGPPGYSQLGVDQSHLQYLHSHTGAEDDLGRRFLASFIAALDDADLPADPEFRAAMTAYMGWAVDQFMAIAPPDAPLPEHPTIPRWEWNGLERG